MNKIQTNKNPYTHSKQMNYSDVVMLTIFINLHMSSLQEENCLLKPMVLWTNPSAGLLVETQGRRVRPWMLFIS